MKAIWHMISGRRGGASVLLFFLSIGIVSSTFLAYPKPAQAQWVVSAPDVVTAIVGDQVKRSVTDALIEAGVLALVNSVNYFTSQVAYYAALAILSDCPGQKSCWDSKAIGQMLKDAALGSIGEAIGTLNEELGLQKLGFNLCKPSLNATMRIQLGLMDEFKPPGPKCSWNEISSSYTALKDSVASGEMLESMKPVFEPGQTPIGVQMGILDGVWGVRGQATKENTLDRLTAAAAGGEFSHVINPTSGRILAPAEVTKAEFRTAYEAREKDPKNYSASTAAGQIASRAALSVAVNAAQTFAMTIISRLWNKLVNGLLSTEELLEFQPDLIFNPEAILQPPGEEGVAEQQQRKTISAVPTRDASTFDPLIEYTTCQGAKSGPNNCVMDAQFANAVRIGDATPLTVREALEKKMLHADWPLIPTSWKEKDQDPYCYSFGYCESNLKKLRGSRIIPIGWEIAAAKSPSGNPVSLGEVVSKFDDCNTSGEADSAHPWCHLINPDWVLKAPPTQCRATVNGPFLESSETNTRGEICADVATCLRQDDLGACTGGWGYCMRERNAWRFNGDQCPFYYNSCRTFTTRSGNTANYLLNTVDHGVCNADNVGCTKYSTALNVATCTLDASCTKPEGCICELDTPLVSCNVSRNKDNCTDNLGGVCRLNYVCGSSSCACEVNAACRVQKDQKTCTTVKGDETNGGDDWLTDPQRYFNKNVEPCSPDQGGCSALIPLGGNGSLNLIRNGSFEELEDGDVDGTADQPKFWSPFGEVPSGPGRMTTSANAVHSGERAILAVQSMKAPTSSFAVDGVCTLPSSCGSFEGCTCTSGDYTCKVNKGQKTCAYTNRVMQTDIPVSPNKTYSLSAYVYGVSGFAPNAVMQMTFKDANGATVNIAADEVVSTTNYQRLEVAKDELKPPVGQDFCGGSSNIFRFAFDYHSDGPWTKKVIAKCTFIILDPKVRYATLELGGYLNNTDSFFDDIQLEEGGGTPYHDGYNVAIAPVYAKVPPPYLLCSGDETERQECSSYAGICRENEVGCERYTPVNGDPAVPGITGPNDACPAECAGYDVFKQEKTEFDVSKFPLYFIPSTAKECTETESGCSQFTNVKTEKVDYYTRLRLCEPPSDDPLTVFYTWEGSEKTGYQLRLWNLKHNDSSSVNRMKPDGTVLPSPSTPLVDQMTDISLDLTASTAGPSPCTKLDVATASTCISKDSNSPAGDLTGFCNKQDIDAGNLDCREFYDAEGNRHYRLLSRTILLTEQCEQYRITQSTKTDCESSSGRWDVAKGQCFYNADISESASCAEASNGCRPYKGNASSNVRTVFFDNFEGGSIGPDWTDLSDNQSEFELSTESIVVGGHSLKIKTSGGSEDEIAFREVGGMVAPLRFYTMSFWARGTGNLGVGFSKGEFPIECKLLANCEEAAGCECTTSNGLKCTVPDNDDTCDVPPAGSGVTVSADIAGGLSDRIPLTTDWREYTVGPISVKAPTSGPAWGTYPVKIRFAPRGRCTAGPNIGASCDPESWTSDCGGGGVCLFHGDTFIDNLVMKEVPDSIYVVRDSWKTPASCDSTPDGVPSPQEMLGCKEYLNTAGSQVFLRSFTNLCRDRAVGCKAYSNTQNTPTNFYSESFNAVCQLKATAGDVGAPRQCGRCNLACDISDPNGCPCDNGFASCTVPSGGTYCTDTSDPSLEGAACVCHYDTGNLAANDAGSPRELADVCRVPIGESECRFKYDRADYATKQGDFPDRVNISADERAYLVVRDANLCDSSAMSCKNLGAGETVFEAVCNYYGPDKAPFTADDGPCESDTCKCDIQNTSCDVLKGESACIATIEKGMIGSWKGVTVKDNPANYEKSLCTSPAVSCEQFSAVDGIFYFKNPENRVCEFKESVTIDNKPFYGWFRKSPNGADIPCYPELIASGDYYAMYKNADATCVLPGATTCNSSDGCPCSVTGTDAPVCKVFKGNTTCGYQGWAGICSAQYDRCEEFVDPADTSPANLEGRPYYYIMNAKLDVKSCSGEASLKRGCVMFKRTGDTRSLYSTAASYFKSDSENNGGPVTPVDCSGQTRSDLCEERCVGIKNGVCSGTLIPCNKSSSCPAKYCSVSHDVCSVPGDCGAGEGSCVTVPGTAANRCIGDKYYGPACETDSDCNASAGEACKSGDAYPYTFTKNDANMVIRVRKDRECAEWLDCTLTSTQWDSAQGKWKNVCGGFLGCNQSRQVGASSECGAYSDTPLEILTEKQYVARSVTYSGLEYAGYSIPNRFPLQFIQLAKGGEGMNNKLYGVPTEDPPKSCKTNSDCPGAKCYSGYCFQSYAGESLVNASVNRAWCRGYPETDSPFGSTIVDGATYNVDGTAKGIKGGFAGANTCIEGNNCECHYVRNEYGKGAVVRFNGLYGSIPKNYDMVCVGGPNVGQSCEPWSTENDDCLKEEGGTCATKSEVAQAIGWEGFCVDPDLSFNINGDFNQYACNLWLPVDQLAGAPDINNQATGAGFQANASKLLYCKEAQGNRLNSSYTRTIFDEGTYHPDDPNTLISLGDGEGFYRDDTWTYSGSTIHKSQISGIHVWVNGACDYGTGGGPSTDEFYLYPNADFSKWHSGVQWANDDTSSEIIGQGGLHGWNQTTTQQSGTTNWCIQRLDMGGGKEGPCESVTDDESPGFNCLSLAAYFDGNGNFQKLRGNTCFNDSADGGCDPSFLVKVDFEMREQCTQVALTSDDVKATSPNITWTDRMIKGYSDTGYDKEHSSSRPYDGTLDQKFFGRIQTQSTISPTVVNFTPPPAKIWNQLLPVYSSEGGSAQTFVEWKQDTNEYVKKQGATASGIPFACVGDCNSSDFTIPSSWRNKGVNAWQTGEANLSQLFVVGWQTYKWNGGSSNYPKVGNDPSWDRRAQYMDGTTLPRVVAVDMGNCRGTGVCPEGSEGLTVNSRMAGDIVQTGGKLPVRVQYYAWADKDHMPIRKRVIDFGDGGASIPSGDPSYFKNRRGCKSSASKCQQDSSGTVKAKCDDSDWGTSPQACDSFYFEDVKTYTCNQARVDALAAAGKLCGPTSGYPCTRAGACVFQPRVRIVDNWGQCNGKCPGAPGNGDVCMNNAIDNLGLHHDDTSSNNECGATYDPASTKQAWTPYDGEVILYP